MSQRVIVLGCVSGVGSPFLQGVQMAILPCPRRAMLLMQILPHSAGKDAGEYLFGKARFVMPCIDSNREKITIGAAYLHVLHYRYARRVKHMESRCYCAITAYNTIASNAARAFIDRASFNQAVTTIHKLAPRQVYVKLKNFLPDVETRRYVEKATRSMEK